MFCGFFIVEPTNYSFNQRAKNTRNIEMRL